MRHPFPNLFQFKGLNHNLGRELLMIRPSLNLYPFPKLFLRPKPKPKPNPKLFLKPKPKPKQKPKLFLKPKPKRALGEAFRKMNRRRPFPNLNNQGDASRAAF